MASASSIQCSFGFAVVFTMTSLCSAGAAPLMIVGNDEKVLWDDQGKVVLSSAGRDTVTIVDLADPENPKIAATLPVGNSVVGPPVNVAIDPTNTLALVADSVDVIQDGDTLKQVPNDKVHVIDLKSDPPKVMSTVTVGKQPSGLDINPKGDLALVANRADNSISVLTIKGAEVAVSDTVAMNDSVAAVAFTPDGRHALTVKFPAHKIALLDVTDGKVTYSKLDLPTGLWPYNVAVTPDGRLALTADNGNAGSSDGSVDTVSVVDLEAQPPRVIDRVIVGDGPEGLTVSPKGNLAAAAILRGSNMKSSYFYNRNGSVAVLRIDGKKVSLIKDIEVGGLPEAVCFTPDGRYLYVGNYLDSDFSILRVDGTEVTDTGKRLKLSGHPASAWISPR
jgi:DNA-binding beta-propeller fold protein YncE